MEERGDVGVIPLTQILSPSCAFVRILDALEMVRDVPPPPEALASRGWRDVTAVAR